MHQHPLPYLRIISFVSLILTWILIPRAHCTHLPFEFPDLEEQKKKKPKILECKHLNLPPHPDPQRKRLRLSQWSLTNLDPNQRRFTRKAYRMGILAKIAYWDFRRDDDIASHMAFALRDDPSLPSSLRPIHLVPQKKSIHSFLIWVRTRSRKIKSKKTVGDGGTTSYAERAPQKSFDEIMSRIRMILCLCRTRHNLAYILSHVQYNIHISTFHAHYYSAKTTTNENENKNKNKTPRRPLHQHPRKQMCQRKLLDRYDAGTRYQIEWTLQNWHESKAKIKWHDTDLTIATSGESEIVLSFAGTASAADQFTNVQTLEPVTHSGLFSNVNINENKNQTTSMDETRSSSTIEGSIHRGFLNAYSRVVKGNILRLCENENESESESHHHQKEDHANHTASAIGDQGDHQDIRNTGRCKTMLTKSLHRRYDICIAAQKSQVNKVEEKEDDETFEGTENIDEELLHEDMNFRDQNQEEETPSSAAEENYVSSRSRWGRFKRSQRERRKKKKDAKSKKNGIKVAGCQSQGERLMDIVREVVIDALDSGHSVYLTGHSQGGAISTLLAFDVIINFPNVPISKLHLWTFGAPEVADSAFYESVGRASSRFRAFLRDGDHYQRFVTRAHNCDTDFVTTLASKNLNRRTARRLGGVRGDIVHAAEPTYIPLMAETSGMEGHFMRNYLKGISIVSPDHPLRTDFPPSMSEWIGEVE